MGTHTKIRKALVLSYFRSIEVSSGIPIVVLLYREDETELHRLRNWQSVTDYDSEADISLLESTIDEIHRDPTETSAIMLTLLKAENAVRVEEVSLDRAFEIIASL